MVDYDAIVLLSFGGPEHPEEVMPFLENVVAGRNVPRARLAAVAAHYDGFDGVSPINAANRALLAALIAELNRDGPRLPVYWGNRFWHPLLDDTLAQMADDGVRHALAMVTSAFGSYSGCRAYLEHIERARQAIGPAAPQVDKLRLFYNHPGFIEAAAERVDDAVAQVPAERLAAARLLFTAHSLPREMAAGCAYEAQLRNASQLVVAQLAQRRQARGATSALPPWELVYQSRSGPPTQPWLEPDVGDRVQALAGDGARDIVVVPIGFLCDHMEVVYDLDVELGDRCAALGLNMIRAGTVGCHPRFVQMIRELIVERTEPGAPRLALGAAGPWPDVCPTDCCAPRASG